MNEDQEINGKTVDSSKVIHNNNESIEREASDENDTTCGIGNWRPKCLQKLATPNVFLLNVSLVAIFQGASFTYLIGSISTLEKRYGFESKISGFILIADNLSQMVLNPFIGYLGVKYNKPTIMAIGELIVAISCFMCVIPYFMYGSVSYTLTTNSVNNFTYYEHEVCDANRNNDCTESPTIWTAVIILWTASFVNGMGYTAFYTVGLPYMDDSTSKKNSPIYLSLSAAIRLFGPAFGFLLSSICLNIYENPFDSPDFPRNDPRWIGAWWIGYLIIGTALIFCSIPLMLFPTRMKNKKPHITEPNNGNTKKMAFESFKRLVTNPVFMFNLFGMNLRLLGYLGYYIYKPKYVEAQFRKSASVANFWTGLTSIPTMAIGILAGGICLSKIKPKAKNLVIYMFIVELLTNIAILGAMFLRCPLPIFPQALIKNGNLDLKSACNENCKCTQKLFQPVCADDRVSNYFSPCYAGCTSFNQTSSAPSEQIFSGCSCIDEYAKVTNGYCGTDCNMFPLFVTLLGVAGVVGSTAKIGDTLLTLRCVEPRDKSFAMGIIGSFLAVFAFIPYPLIYGAITDMSCIVWKESCGKTGNCWLYDSEKFGHYLHLTSFTFLMIGTLFDIPIIYYASRIKNMFDDDDNEPNREYEMGKANIAFNGSIDRSLNADKSDKLEIEEEMKRKGSLTDYELVHRKNSFVSI